MTAVLEPAALPTPPLRVIRDREQARREALFEATRPADPDWCDKTCDTLGNFGDAVLHYSEPDMVPAAVDFQSKTTGDIGVMACRFDSLDDDQSAAVVVTDPSSLFVNDDWVYFSPEQARRLAAKLLQAADRVQPEQVLLASDVKIDDRIRVDGKWLKVYMVLVDESANDVQIAVIEDEEEWSDFDQRDENPEHFELADLVLVRRGGA